MDAFLWSSGVQAVALVLAKGMSTQELTRAALFFTQLGATMGTIAAIQGLDAADAAETEAGVSTLL